MKKIKVRKIVELIFVSVMVVTLSWIGISFIEVVCNNLNTGYEYTSWNFFKVMLDLCK